MAHAWQQPEEEDYSLTAPAPSVAAIQSATISSPGWRGVLERTLRHMKDDRVTIASGSLAYNLFLALFPAVIAALGILTLIHLSSGTLHTLTHGLAKGLPSGAAGVFKAAVATATKRVSGTSAAVVIGIAVSLWSVSSAMATLQQTLDIAYGISADRKFLASRLRAVPMMAMTAVLGGLGAILIVFGKPIGSSLQGFVPLGGMAFTVAWTAVRWIAAFFAISLLFSSYYYLAPNRRAKWQWVSPGSLLASGVFLLASLGFSFYVSSFGSYGKTYGSFAGVAILIFWLYLTGLAVLIGGELNAEIERGRAAPG